MYHLTSVAGDYGSVNVNMEVNVLGVPDPEKVWLDKNNDSSMDNVCKLKCQDQDDTDHEPIYQFECLHRTHIVTNGDGGALINHFNAEP